MEMGLPLFVGVKKINDLLKKISLSKYYECKNNICSKTATKT